MVEYRVLALLLGSNEESLGPVEVTRGNCKQPCLLASTLLVKQTGVLCPGVLVEGTTVMPEP